MANELESALSLHIRKENVANYNKLLQYCKKHPKITISDIFNSVIPSLQNLEETTSGAIFLKIQKGIIPIK